METRHIYSMPERELSLQEWCKKYRVGTNLPTPTCENAKRMMELWPKPEKRYTKLNILAFVFNLS